MPCTVQEYGSGPSREDLEIRASWCAILTVLENSGMLESVLTACDWKEAGVTKAEVLKWWAEHKEQDRKRRAWERADRKKREVKKQALAKLTPEERKALGNL